VPKRVLHIASGLSIPVEYVTATSAIVAIKRSGKTYTGSVLAEEMLKIGVQVVVVDPTGAWWGLRAGKDKEHHGFPVVIFGGEHADIPISETSGTVVATAIIQHRMNAVVDLSSMSESEQLRFATEFLATVYQKNREPMHLFIDEADALAPQKPMGTAAHRCLKAMNDIVRRGGIKGIGTTLITQRTAVINKDVLTQAETLFVLRTVHKRDRETIEAWVSAHDVQEKAGEMMGELAALPNGTCFVWSPDLMNVFKKVEVRERETFNSSATPKFGQRIKPPKKLDAVEFAALKEQFAQTIERAKMENPAELRKRIAELDMRLRAKAPTEKIVEEKVKIEVHEVPIITETQVKRMETTFASVVNAYTKTAERMEVSIQKTSKLLEKMFAEVKSRADKFSSPPRNKDELMMYHRGSHPPLPKVIEKPIEHGLKTPAVANTISRVVMESGEVGNKGPLVAGERRILSAVKLFTSAGDSTGDKWRFSVSSLLVLVLSRITRANSRTSG